MKRYEERTREPETYKVLVERKCDLCGHVAKTENWGAVMYDVNETEVRIEVRQKEGFSTPEGGSGTKYEVDLCPKCFKEKLVPWLRSQGADIPEMKWDW